jgi:hypothetical protein
MPPIEWRSLQVMFTDCDTGSARFDGGDGLLQIDLKRLVGLEGFDCN